MKCVVTGVLLLSFLCQGGCRTIPGKDASQSLTTVERQACEQFARLRGQDRSREADQVAKVLMARRLGSTSQPWTRSLVIEAIGKPDRELARTATGGLMAATNSVANEAVYGEFDYKTKSEGSIDYLLEVEFVGEFLYRVGHPRWIH